MESSRTYSNFSSPFVGRDWGIVGPGGSVGDVGSGQNWSDQGRSDLTKHWSGKDQAIHRSEEEKR